MAIKFNESTKTWDVTFWKRHPVSREAKRFPLTGIRSESEALRAYKILVKKADEWFEREKERPITYGKLLSQFKLSMQDRDLSNLTIDNYMSCLSKHTALWEGRTLDKISTEEIRQLVKVGLRSLSASQQKNVLKYVRGIFEFAVESGYIVRNPTPKLSFKIGDKIKKVLTQQQARLLLEKASEYQHEWYPIWVAALYTGMRNGELYSLTWDKVDLDEKTIIVSSTWNKKDGFKDLTKSRQDRIIEIAGPLLSIFRDLKMKSDGSPFVLPRMADWETGRQAEILRAFLMSIGLHRIRFHDLRASWATMLLSKGVQPSKVMVLGGWKDLKTLMIYLRKAGIETKGTLEHFSIHDVAMDSRVLEFKTPNL